ncbi:hypothetical protein ACFQI9_33820 [Paraburkholderia dipogonis]|uniref:hypothetical protein n=1 Tax=Paraburkholderia dipogonis TaxID=1211383 RepID=UPI00360A4350
MKSFKSVQRWMFAGALAGAMAMVAHCGIGVAHAQSKPKKDKYLIYLSLSYSGNAWQSEAANVVKALAKTPLMTSSLKFVRSSLVRMYKRKFPPTRA